MFLTLVIYYVIFCVCLFNFVWYKTLKYHVLKEEDMKIHEKYFMFRRRDLQFWNYWKFLAGAICFWWLKIAFLIFSIISTYVRLKLLLWGKTIQDIEKITDEKLLKQIKEICHQFGVLFRISFAIIIKDKHVKVDYSKYLGENYEKDEKKIKVTSYVSNHNSILDCAILSDRFYVCFISRSNIKSYPLIGFLACCCGCIFVDRASKDNRGNALDKIIEKQHRLYEGKDITNVAVFAEGTTTNNTCIIPFKKGAFAANLPVKPVVVNYDVTHQFSIAMDIIDLLYNVFLVMCVPYRVVELVVLPSFEPNEYLYDVYGKEMIANGKEKWEVYADAVRDAMCIGSGLKKANGDYKMKVEYLNYFRKGIKPKID